MVRDLCAEGLHFRYREKPVLDGADLDIREGEVFGILGPNGCGKTTLLKNLNRNLSPESGRVLIGDDDIADMAKKDIAREIAAVPQGNEIRFSFTVRDIVAMGRMPFQRQFEGESSSDGEIIDQAMRDVGIWNMRSRHINEMSGGERQRVIIARALAQTPRYLLMDEPTNHLDINMQFEVLDLVHRLSREKGLTVVIVSHDLPMAARYCDRAALIADHRVMCCGTPEEVLTPENMRLVFGIDAELTKDSKTGMNSVILHGSVRRN
ncbi:ABC transporter [Candidatus Methanomethylophilus sp. 1R26]|uniref:ABC transporter ATP-binding protein n=1 Tax=Candidatus Methanomethylophilus sp. 1R26 TaxID=1769296 RepID=UPI0007365243|nr:ABC transporter ATP-binding protein [Candidatus Methanomethylophilus sp. 1R26]KUE74424.1 ABC transporter [Candidatus Methanomethylophilus sp. 1R26]